MGSWIYLIVAWSVGAVCGALIRRWWVRRRNRRYVLKIPVVFLVLLLTGCSTQNFVDFGRGFREGFGGGTYHGVAGTGWDYPPPDMTRRQYTPQPWQQPQPPLIHYPSGPVQLQIWDAQRWR